MKKKLVALLTVLSVVTILLAACGGQAKALKAADFEKVTMGMSDKDLEKELGKPAKILKDGDKKAEEAAAEDATAFVLALAQETDEMKAFIGDRDASEAQQELAGLTNANKGKVYQYKYKDKDDKEQTRNIYVFDDKVMMMSFN